MTAPLTPPDCDLRGYEYMPLYGHHLFGSDFNARVSDAGWRAAVTLWWAAWNQVPAASLPDDDIALTRLADLGRDVKGFRKIRSEAMHGYVLCSDGRLYHGALSRWAVEAWEIRVKERERKARWRNAKTVDKNVPATGTATGTETPPERLSDADVPAEGKRSEVKRSEVQEPSVGENLGNSTAVDNPEIRADKSAKVNGNNQFRQITPWHLDPKQVAVEAKRQGIERRPGESQSDFTDRVKHAAMHPQARA